jgi:hypothetical protein
MAGKVKAWVWIVIGVVVFGILGVVAMAAAGLWFVRSHVDIRTTTVAAATERPQTLRIMAFDSHDEKVVNLQLPFWLLRLKGGGSRFDIGRSNIDLARMRLTVEDLERYGPILILDQKDTDGSRVLIWSQ